MPKRIEDDGFATHILDLLAPWSVVEPRRMFGGVGLFANGRMFAIILDDFLYLKDSLDEQGMPVKTSFEKEYFEFSRKDRIVRISYFKAPGRALEESDYLIELAKASYQSSSVNKKKKVKETEKATETKRRQAAETKTKKATKNKPLSERQSKSLSAFLKNPHL